MVMFGVCCWDWVVVSVDGWLLAGWWWLVVAVAVVSAAISHVGGSGVGVGRWWCVWGTCWFVRPDRGVPYFPVECIPVGLGERVGEGRVNIFWVGRDDVASVQRGGTRSGGQVGVVWS